MKRYRSLIIASLCAMLYFSACEKDFETPEVDLFIAETLVGGEYVPAITITANTTVRFTIKGLAENFVLWTGDPGRDYNNFLEQSSQNVGTDTIYTRTYNRGTPVRMEFINNRYESTVNYTYPLTAAGGTYKALLIATNGAEYGKSTNVVKKEILITVTEP